MNILVKLIVCMAALLVSNTAAQSGEDGSGESKPRVNVLIKVYSKIFLGCPGGVRYTVQPPTELNWESFYNYFVLSIRTMGIAM